MFIISQFLSIEALFDLQIITKMIGTEYLFTFLSYTRFSSSPLLPISSFPLTLRSTSVGGPPTILKFLTGVTFTRFLIFFLRFFITVCGQLWIFKVETSGRIPSKMFQTNSWNRSIADWTGCENPEQDTCVCSDKDFLHIRGERSVYVRKGHEKIF